MKKSICVLLSLTLLLGAASFLAGCGGGDAEENAAPDEVTLLDFEDNDDFLTCRISDAFGKVSVNTDKRFVRSGERSAEVIPLGAGWMYFTTVSDRFGLEYNDFSYVDFVSVKVYNAQEEDATVSLGLVGSASLPTTSMQKITEERCTLKPGWNTLSLFPNEMLIWLMSYRIDEVNGISFTFENNNSTVITEESDRFYIDDVVIKYKDTPAKDDFSAEELTAAGIRENEVIDFESPILENAVTSEKYSVEVVTAESVGLKAPSGKKILHLRIPEPTNAWQIAFRVPGALLSRVLGGMTEEQIEKAYFCFEGYNDTDVTVNMTHNYYFGNDRLDTKNEMDSRRWTPYSYKLSDVNARFAGWTDNPGAIAFWYNDVQSGVKDFYFDNFRIEIRES